MSARQPGLTLMEIAVTLALGAIVMLLVGSLFVASSRAWRRGSDVREAQVQANTLIEVMMRDIRSGSQAPSVMIRPPITIDEGEPLLSVVTTADAGPNWVLYVRYPDRREVVRQIVVPAGDGRVTVRDSRIVATGVEQVTVTPTGDGVTVEVEARRGRDVAFARGSAAPRNP
jgi:prepilin-type N-terminal cleavage/methylation domain-containing protein